MKSDIVILSLEKIFEGKAGEAEIRLNAPTLPHVSVPELPPIHPNCRCIMLPIEK